MIRNVLRALAGGILAVSVAGVGGGCVQKAPIPLDDHGRSVRKDLNGDRVDDVQTTYASDQWQKGDIPCAPRYWSPD